MQRLKEIQEEFKRLSSEVSQLKNSIDELQAAIPVCKNLLTMLNVMLRSGN